MSATCIMCLIHVHLSLTHVYVHVYVFQLDTRIMCVTGLGDRILLIGTLAKRLYAYNLKTK